MSNATPAAPAAVRTHAEGGVLTIILDRPKANAINVATSHAFGRRIAGPPLRERDCVPRECEKSGLRGNQT